MTNLLLPNDLYITQGSENATKDCLKESVSVDCLQVNLKPAFQLLPLFLQGKSSGVTVNGPKSRQCDLAFPP